MDVSPGHREDRQRMAMHGFDFDQDYREDQYDYRGGYWFDHWSWLGWHHGQDDRSGSDRRRYDPLLIQYQTLQADKNVSHPSRLSGPSDIDFEPFVTVLSKLQRANEGRSVDGDFLVTEVEKVKPNFLQEANVHCVEEYVKLANRQYDIDVALSATNKRILVSLRSGAFPSTALQPSARNGSSAQPIRSVTSQEDYRSPICRPTYDDERVAIAWTLRNPARRNIRVKFNRQFSAEDVRFLIRILEDHGERLSPASRSRFMPLSTMEAYLTDEHNRFMKRQGFANLRGFAIQASSVANIWVTNTSTANDVLWLADIGLPFRVENDTPGLLNRIVDPGPRPRSYAESSRHNAAGWDEEDVSVRSEDDPRGSSLLAHRTADTHAAHRSIDIRSAHRIKDVGKGEDTDKDAARTLFRGHSEEAELTPKQALNSVAGTSSCHTGHEYSDGDASGSDSTQVQERHDGPVEPGKSRVTELFRSFD